MGKLKQISKSLDSGDESTNNDENTLYEGRYLLNFLLIICLLIFNTSFVYQINVFCIHEIVHLQLVVTMKMLGLKIMKIPLITQQTKN